MSVRRIPKNYSNLTGLGASEKADSPFFESTLERDWLTLLDFNKKVLTYDVQPVTIDWLTPENKKKTYTPDVLVHYRSGTAPIASVDTILYEVKYRSDIFKNWAEYKLKFKKAINYANCRNWRFKLITEQEIRTPYMENARFLLPYLSNDLDDSHAQMLIHRLVQLRQTSVSGLIASIFNDKWAQAELLQSLWYLVAERRILTDLTQPLTMSSSIWIGENSGAP